jgi:hypothetical protein
VSKLRVLLTRQHKAFCFNSPPHREKNSRAFKMSLGAFDPLLTTCAMHLTYSFKGLAPSSDLLVKISGFQVRKGAQNYFKGAQNRQNFAANLVPTDSIGFLPLSSIIIIIIIIIIAMNET